MAHKEAATKSTTFWLILVPFTIVNFRYLLNSFDVSFINQDSMSPEGFATACSLLIAVWVGRECKEVWKNKGGLEK